MSLRGACLSLMLVAAMFAACDVQVWLGDGPLSDSEVPGASSAVEKPPSCLVAVPQALTFEVVRDGEEAHRSLSLRNTCNKPLRLDELAMSGSPGFLIEVAGYGAASGAPADAQVTRFSPVLELAPGGEITVLATFQPSTPHPAFANSVWRVENAEAMGLAVQLSANLETPCLVAFPKSLDFGGVLLGENSEREVIVRSCGAAMLDISALSVVGEAAERFEILGAELEGQAVYPIEDQQTLTLTYRPSEVPMSGPGGEPLHDEASLVIESNAFRGEREIPLKGFGAMEPCPHAVITPGNPSVVEPGALLIFDGAESYGVGSEIVTWAWSLDAPTGSQAFLEATGEPSRVRLVTQALGQHDVMLSVTDAKGLVSCVEALHRVDVVASEGMAVELWWSTEADLDLHLTHELAVGLDLDDDGAFDGWFDKPYDAFWANPSPSWGTLGEGGAADDPVLLFDDYDGYGPERIVLKAPEAGRVYRVGVHHWDDNHTGPASAWVRVYVGGTLVEEGALPALPQDSLWEVGALDSEGVWYPASSEPSLLHGVHKPWQAKGP